MFERRPISIATFALAILSALGIGGVSGAESGAATASAKAVPSASASATTPPSSDSLLKTIARAETVFQTHVERSTVDFYEDGKKQKTMTFLLAIASDSSLALMKEPAYDKGKVILFNSDGYFLYFPTPDRYIRVSPQNSLYGNIS